jgi:hypothetical protein
MGSDWGQTPITILWREQRFPSSERPDLVFTKACK